VGTMQAPELLNWAGRAQGPTRSPGLLKSREIHDMFEHRSCPKAVPSQAAALDRRRAPADLAITLGLFALGSLSVPLVNPILRHGHELPGVLAAAAYQFMLEGLAPLALIVIHRESLRDYGLKCHGTARSLALAVALAVLYDAALSWRAHTLIWIPLRRQPAIRMSLEAGLPRGLVGLAVTIGVWGALEGFFGVYFASKTAKFLGMKETGWLAPGVIAFAFFNGAVHLIVGQGLEGFLGSFASGYAIAVIPAVTGNAWGSLLVQTLTNAAGHL
jgi:hypothetical protein